MDRERAAKAIRDFLDALGQSDAPDLKETPRRVADAWLDELLVGYSVDPKKLLSDRIPSDGKNAVLVRDVSVCCICPHHLMPATGTADVGYVPNGSVVGLGAIADLVSAFGRRLILQEDLGRMVSESIVEHLGARTALCRLSMRHTCLCGRHVDGRHASVETVALAGNAGGLDAALIESLLPRDAKAASAAPDLKSGPR